MTRRPASAPALVALLVAALVAVLVGGCLGVSPASVAPTSGGGPSPSASSSSSPTAPTACPVTEATGVLPSSRLVDYRSASAGGLDRLTFTFGESGTEPLEGRGRLREARPPFSEGGSGLPVEVDGERFLEIRFDGVLVADEEGNAIYEGPLEDRPNLPAVRHVVVTEQFEGVVTFIVGFSGPGCVALSGDPAARTVIVEIQHG